MNLKLLMIKLIELYYRIKYFLVRKPQINYEKEFKKIALILTSPLGIGDLIMMTPLIKSFRINFPKAKIHLITDKDIFENLKEVDKIHIVKGNSLSLRKEFKNLSKENYDLGVVMARAINQSLYITKLKPRFKLGYIAGLKIKSNFKLKDNNLYFDKKDHFRDNSLKIIQTLGLEAEKELITFQYSKKIKDKVKSFHKNLNLDKKKKTILLSPYVVWESRRWDENNYIELIKRLHNVFNIVISGGNDDFNLNLKISDDLKKLGIKVTNITAKLNLKESLEFLNYVDLIVCSDSGPMHFGFLMKRPTIGLFGPINPMQRMPFEFKKKGIYDYLWLKDYTDITKYNYESEPMNKKLFGMKQIPVKDVEAKILKFFKDKSFN